MLSYELPFFASLSGKSSTHNYNYKATKIKAHNVPFFILVILPLSTVCDIRFLDVCVFVMYLSTLKMFQGHLKNEQVLARET